MAHVVRRSSFRSKRRLLSGGIRLRLTLWYVVVLAVVLIIFSATIYLAEAHAIASQQETTLRSQAQQLVERVDLRNWTFDLTVTAAAPKEPLSSFSNQQLMATKAAAASGSQSDPSAVAVTPAPNGSTDVLSPSSLDPKDVVALLDSGGSIHQLRGPALASEMKQLAGDELPEDHALTSDVFFDGSLSIQGSRQPYVLLAVPLLAKKNPAGTLIIGQPDQAAGQLHRLLLTLLLALPVTLLATGICGYWLASRAMSPVRAITRAARDIGENDLSRRLNLPSHDELGELASTFDTMLERLEAAFRRQRRFTSDASHELRTPLTIVNLEVARMLSNDGLSKESQAALATIQGENDYMARLVGDLLTLARSDAGQVVLQHDPLDLSDLTLEVVERLAPLAKARGVTLQLGELPELPLSGDHLYLSRMLANVLENAIKFSHCAAGPIRVETSLDLDTTTSRAFGRVRISDSGPGIPAEHLPRLFEPFYRVDDARTIAPDAPDGSGLGLAIVKWVAEAHGGEVRVDSRPGDGTTVTIRLPLAAG